MAICYILRSMAKPLFKTVHKSHIKVFGLKDMHALMSNQSKYVKNDMKT